ncbi:MAG: HYR domain-containing protein [Acidobacteriota bacterium]
MSFPHKVFSNRLQKLTYLIVLLTGAGTLTGSFLFDTFFTRVGAKPNPVAPISVITLGTAITQNFDTLATSGTTNAWVDDSTLTGWYSQFELNTANPVTYRADAGGSNTGAIYSWGTGTSTERAFGSVVSATPGTIFNALKLTNSTGSTITSLDISYNGEQWRNGGNVNTQQLDFQYQVANAGTITDANSPATGWSDFNALDFVSPITGAAAAALDGNAAANRTAKSATLTVTVNAGQEVWLRWRDINDTGNDHGLSIDDFSVTPNGAANAAIAPTCPPNLATIAGTATSAGVSATDSDGTVTGASITSITPSDPGTITLTGFTPAGGVGGTANATLQVSNTTPVGNYSATITWSNNDATPQTANCIVAVSVAVSSSVAIHDIQGAGHISPLNTTTVSTTGIVTAKRVNGFYIQDPMPDTDDATSEGIFVFTSTAPTVSAGDAVTVLAIVSEFRPGGASSDNLTITELTSPSISVTSTGNPLPAPIIIGISGRIPPSMIIEDDATGNVETSGVFDPSSDGIDFYESLEGMRVQVNNAVVVGPDVSLGEIPVLSDDGANASVRTTRGGVVVRSNDFNPERIILDDEIAGTPLVNVGDHFGGPIVGVMDYSFGNFKLEVTSSPTAVAGGLSQEVAALPTANQLAIATFNVENLDPNDPPSKFSDLAGIIVNNLKSPDLLALEEVQDNNGPGSSGGVVDATQTYNLLIGAIQTAGGPPYQFRQIDPVNNQDGGEPNGNIRVGFLFRTDRGLAFIDRAGGTSTAATTVVNGASGPELSFSPGRVDPTNAAFNNSRKPLAGEFTFNCHKLFVIANHFNSKGGDQPLFGRFQPPLLSSEAQRIQQAQIVNNFVDSILALDPDAEIVTLGDLNDFEFSTPLTTLKGGVLHDLIEGLPQSERYTYVFEGNSQALDHILLSDSLFNRTPVFEYDVVHVNSEFVVRASDHDPQVARLTFDCTADVSVTKTKSPDPVVPGTPLTYTIVVSNPGLSDAANVVVTDNLPAEVVFVSCSSTALGVCGGSGNNRTVTFSTLPAGTTATITITTTVLSSVPSSSTITNTASATTTSTDSNPANDSSTAMTLVGAGSADLAVTKSDSHDPVVAGTNLTYTINFINNGPSTAQSVTVTDAVPANTTFVSASITTGTGWSVSTPAVGGTGNVVFSKTSVAPGETAVFSMVVKVGAATTINNSATGATLTSDPTPGNNTGTATTMVTAQADLAVTKTDSPDPVIAGQNLTYTINFVNNGPSSANLVTVTDPVPANTTFVSATVTTGSVWTTSNPGVGGTGNVVFSKSPVASGETAVFTMVVKVNAGTPNNTIITNSATAASTTADSTSGNNTGTTTTKVIAQADLAVTKSDSPDPVCVNGNITYTINLTNNGPGPGLNTTVTDGVPANTTFVSASVTSGSGWGQTTPGVGGTGNVVFSKASVANGETAVFQIVVKVNSGMLHGTVINNSATAASSIPDPNNGNNTGTAATTVDPAPPVFTNGCPGAINIAAPPTCPFSNSGVVNYATPAASDNCPGVTVACVPPSGSMFPVGSTTVTCTATDAAGNIATCTFPVTVAGVCLQDDSNPGNLVLVDLNTGAYRFCCNGVLVASGTGMRRVRGCLASIEDNSGNSRVRITIDTSVKKGTASIQNGGSILCTISDRNLTDNNCNCP